MRYIDADRLKAEMEKRMHICDGVFERGSDTYYQGKAVAYQETLSFINSLQQEQPCDTCTNDKGCVTCKNGELWEGKEQPSEDLESEMEKYFQGLWPGMETAEQCNTDMHFTPPAIMRLASHFYELGKQSKESVSEDLEAEIDRLWESFADEMEGPHNLYDIYARLARHFANWQKEQMLKDAWEREAKIDSGGYPYIDITAELYDYEHNVPLAKEGELVKIIIVKEEKK